MPTPTGPIAELLQTLETLVVQSPAFIAQCALDGLTPADQVFWHAVRPDPDGEVIAPTPLAYPMVILRVDQFQYDEWAPECMQPKAVVKMQICDRFRSAAFKDSAIDFTNFYGELLDELQRRNYSEGGIVARSIMQANEPIPTQRRDTTSTYGFWCVDVDFQIGAEF